MSRPNCVFVITSYSIHYTKLYDIASGIISLFEGTLNQVVQLAILMPVVAALGGNAGSQGLVVAVRAIAERQLEGDRNNFV